MTEDQTTKRGVLAAGTGSIAALGLGLVCLACVLPGIGAIVGISAIVTAVGGIAEDSVLTLVGGVTLMVSAVLAAYVLVVRRRSGRACAPDVAETSVESRE